jgi:WD40 repeat protein
VYSLDADKSVLVAGTNEEVVLWDCR